jgi:hypothetical protein
MWVTRSRVTLANTLWPAWLASPSHFDVRNFWAWGYQRENCWLASAVFDWKVLGTQWRKLGVVFRLLHSIGEQLTTRIFCAGQLVVNIGFLKMLKAFIYVINILVYFLRLTLLLCLILFLHLLLFINISINFIFSV